MKKTIPTLITSHLPALPPHLGEAGRDLFSKLVTEYDITDAGGLSLVEIAAAAADRIASAQAALSRDGEFMVGANGGMRPHPALNLERTASERLMSAIRNLHLDVPPKLPHGRPPGVNSISWRDL